MGLDFLHTIHYAPPPSSFPAGWDAWLRMLMMVGGDDEDGKPMYGCMHLATCAML